MEQDTEVATAVEPSSSATHSFIRAVEVWAPNASGTALTLSSSDYTGLEAFGQISAETSFALGEGLPGKAWQEQRPVVLKQFEESTFVRTAAARDAGLTSGVAIPVFDGKQLKAVLVLLCGKLDEASGAIEVWQDDGLSGMALVDGYYGEMERFEWLSKQIRFPLGIGLPGTVWQSQQATIMANLANSTSFLRAANAKEAGISTGIGIPFYSPIGSPSQPEDLSAVLVFLSSRDTPLAKRFEIWQQTDDGDGLWFLGGIDQDGETVEPQNRSKIISASTPCLGEAITTGIPVISQNDLANEYQSLLALPIHPQEKPKSVIALYR